MSSNDIHYLFALTYLNSFMPDLTYVKQGFYHFRLHALKGLFVQRTILSISPIKPDLICIGQHKIPSTAR